jgi:hypothetical protein
MLMALSPSFNYVQHKKKLGGKNVDEITLGSPKKSEDIFFKSKSLVALWELCFS